MFGIDWSDPQTLWLNLTNLALGVVTLVALLAVFGAVAWEMVWKRRRARDTGIDAELQSMLEEASPHSFTVPELGLTMADGGVPVKGSAAEPAERKQARS